MNLNSLVQTLTQTHQFLQQQASQAINYSLVVPTGHTHEFTRHCLANWLSGISFSCLVKKSYASRLNL
mgnify:CR=1 FL=1